MKRQLTMSDFIAKETRQAITNNASSYSFNGFTVVPSPYDLYVLVGR